MNLSDFRFAVDKDGLTIVYCPIYSSIENREEFFKYSRETGAYVGFVGSDVIRNNPEYAVRITGSKCWLVLVPPWHKNYIVRNGDKETMMIMMDGSGRGMVLEDATTTLRLVAQEANIGCYSNPYIYLSDWYDEDDDEYSFVRETTNLDLWTSKEYDRTQTAEQRCNFHLELAIAAFKHATNAATRGNKVLPHLMQRIHDAIMEGPPHWRQIFDDSRKYFASK